MGDRSERQVDDGVVDDPKFPSVIRGPAQTGANFDHAGIFDAGDELLDAPRLVEGMRHPQRHHPT